MFWLLGQALASGSPVGAVVGYLAFINLLLGGFNLLPGFPLDGGRVLRSLVWGATGNVQRATQVASYAGQAVGWLLIVWLRAAARRRFPRRSVDRFYRLVLEQCRRIDAP
jgi:Zn-dependent protease